MPSVRPEHDDAFWAALAERPWRRVRWRRARTPDAPPEGARCVAFGTPIHRAGTYYVRPAYTDGEAWLSQQAYEAMVRRTRGGRASRRTSDRPAPPDG
ncbi:hypothetical protein [Rubrivirga litoralis]|uniref:Uncharacterized protein n=1 Tax=Rubrivirga litoralis TaxID=3075598 RepID=A0ABU3BT44_9BACT|nr:hypothetical protein [Rubrivirga sp. F394]MDT0632455.1 hypothetical protein [Rubrivirga sp. F394]